MLHPQEVSPTQIGEVLAQAYGVQVESVVQRPAGADAGATVYQLATPGGGQWWLKCRRHAVDDGVWKVLQHLRYTAGITEIVAPQPTRTGRPALDVCGLQWTLFPYVDAPSGFEVALSQRQWQRLGQVLRRLHDTRLPYALAATLAQANFDDDTAVERVGAWLHRAGDPGLVPDALGSEYLALWRQYRLPLLEVWQRCVTLRGRLTGRPARVLCHADLHAGNVLVCADERLCLIDWDGMLMAPRERDLMFMGAAVGGRWGREDPPGFASGYGETVIDRRWLAYYRHWRILHDVQEFHDLLLEPGATARPPAQRRQALRYMAEQFAAGNVVDAAARSWQAAVG